MDNLPKDPPDDNGNSNPTPPSFGSNFNPHSNPVDPNNPYQNLTSPPNPPETDSSQHPSYSEVAQHKLRDSHGRFAAEIIGSSPHLLAFSLYDEIITGDVWHRARSSQGYTDVSPAQLVVLFGNKPYVDIRNTFNSFVPANLSQTLRERLVGFYLEKLRRNLSTKINFT